jgi:hypothetical protein
MERIKAGEGVRCGQPIDIEDESDVKSAMRDFFLPELVRMGVVMDIDCKELHLGSYGRLSI